MPLRSPSQDIREGMLFSYSKLLNRLSVCASHSSCHVSLGLVTGRETVHTAIPRHEPCYLYTIISHLHSQLLQLYPVCIRIPVPHCCMHMCTNGVPDNSHRTSLLQIFAVKVATATTLPGSEHQVRQCHRSLTGARNPLTACTGR